MVSVNTRKVRLITSLILGIPSYSVFALIRDFPFSQITLYAHVEYGLAATFAFFSIFEVQTFKSKFLNRNFDWKEKWRIRAVIEVLSSLLITAIIVYFTYSFLYLVVWDMDIYMPSVYLYVSLVFFVSLCFAAFVNAVPIIEEWEKSLIKAEKLEKESITARMEALQTQLSPHFFFNNLSILNGLISENPSIAQDYTSRLSEVFRYLLSNKNHEIVMLKKEVEFIKDYIFLLENRFKDKFKVNLQLSDMNYWIPPVTLQQLLENAIKHNEVSYHKSLIITIKQENDYLIVENLKQRKKNVTESTGLGIKNIIQRFQILTDKQVYIEDTESSFIIKIPLITYESSNN